MSKHRVFESIRNNMNIALMYTLLRISVGIFLAALVVLGILFSSKVYAADGFKSCIVTLDERHYIDGNSVRAIVVAHNYDHDVIITIGDGTYITIKASNPEQYAKSAIDLIKNTCGK